MADLSETLRTAAPGMKGFTLWKTAHGWQAGRQNPDGSWRVSEAPDIVEAAHGALCAPQAGMEDMLS